MTTRCARCGALPTALIHTGTGPDAHAHTTVAPTATMCPVHGWPFLGETCESCVQGAPPIEAD